jgi:hypothetical protein
MALRQATPKNEMAAHAREGDAGHRVAPPIGYSAWGSTAHLITSRTPCAPEEQKPCLQLFEQEPLAQNDPCSKDSNEGSFKAEPVPQGARPRGRTAITAIPQRLSE